MTSTTIVKAPVIPQGWNINLTPWSLTGSIPLGYYDWTETITASDTDLLASNIKFWVDIFWVNGSFAWNNNPLFSNIEFNISWLVVMADSGSGGYSPWFVSWCTIIWWNLYQVANIMHRDDNSNSSDLWHYTVILKRTPAWVVTRYVASWAAWQFTTWFSNNTTINVNWTTIQIHTAYWSWFFINFDTTTDTFSAVSWGSSNIQFWSDYTNYWTNNALSVSWAPINRVASTGAVSWTWMPATIVFWWFTYWCTHLCVHRSFWTWAWQSFQVAFSTKI